MEAKWLPKGCQLDTKSMTNCARIESKCLRFALPAEAGFEALKPKKQKKNKRIIFLLIFNIFYRFSLIFIDFH
jgi:hypothetical protein